ncbi:MAG: endo-1,4-beta-xylanase [Treponema sp.]|nr:endo-1,4-beta-xylanase [Treponema sp.]
MKRLKMGRIFFLLISVGILAAGCPNANDEDSQGIARTFKSLTQNGSAKTATTKLTLTFDDDITGLAASDITLTAGTTGANKGALTRTTKGVYDLALSGITNSGSVTVLAEKSGYTITGGPKTVSIFCLLSIDDGDNRPLGSGNSLTLTIGARRDLKPHLGDGAAGKTITWTSSAATVASVNNGIVTAVNFSSGGTSTASSAATGTATITAKSTDNAFTQTFTITTTMAGQIDMMSTTPLKDRFADYFLIGNIATQSNYSTGTSGTITNQRLIRHYNVLTAENHMKPDSFSSGYNSSTGAITYTWTNADNFVNAATNSGFKILAHVLLWHSQIPQWQKDLGNPSKKDEALTAMKKFITDVVTRYKGKIWAWDVLNEVFPDGVSAGADWKTSMRTTGDSQGPNPWYVAIGSDFVYEGYLAARLADPAAILYYNDYNLDNAGKATMVRNMVRDVNARYAEAYPAAGRKLIEGIGMQSHHNTNVSVNSIKATLDRFKPLGVKISISEIDVLSQSWSDYSSSTPPTNSQKLTAANLYGDYFKLFIQYSDIIERVTFWGVYDEQSWRARGLPLIFEGSSTSRAKPAYYKIVGALD